MRVRRYQSSDAESLQLLMVQSITELGSTNYNDRQIQAWLSRVPDKHQFDRICMDGRYVIVAAGASDQPMAFIDLEASGHIDHLYCSPEVARNGLATKIYGSVERIAKRIMLPRLYSEASEVALPFFSKNGFNVLFKHEFEIGEVWIHNYTVEKYI